MPKIAYLYPINVAQIPAIEVEIPDRCPHCKADLHGKGAIQVSVFLLGEVTARLDRNNLHLVVDHHFEPSSEAFTQDLTCATCGHSIDYVRRREVCPKCENDHAPAPAVENGVCTRCGNKPSAPCRDCKWQDRHSGDCQFA